MFSGPTRPKSAETGPGRFGWLFNITIVIVPWPFLLSSLNWPTYFWPLSHVNVSWPFLWLSFHWPSYFEACLCKRYSRNLRSVYNAVIWKNDKVKWKISRDAFTKNSSHKFLEQAADIATLKMEQVMGNLKMSNTIKLCKNGCLNYEIELLNFFLTSHFISCTCGIFISYFLRLLKH